MTSSNQRLEELRGLLHNSVSEANSIALAKLLNTWPDDDAPGRQVAHELSEVVIRTWVSQLEQDLSVLTRSFPDWTRSHRVKVSVRLCGGDTARRIPEADDEFVNAEFRGVPERFEAVCVDDRTARTPNVNEAPHGVIWLIETPPLSPAE